MSEERLKEIKKCIKHDLIHNDGMMISVSIKDTEWLIEQAKRVKELEASEEGRELAHKLIVHYAKEKEQQNKRYREAITRVISLLKIGEHTHSKMSAVSVLNKALEELE